MERRGPSLRRAPLLLLALVVLAVAGWSAWSLLTSRTLLEQARSSLEAARDEQDAAAVDARLARAQERLSRADRRLSAPGPRAVELVPLLGRNPTAVRLSTEAGLASVTAARDVLRATEERPLLAAGQVDLAGLARVEQALRRAARDVAPATRRLAAAELGLTLPPVEGAVLEARGRLDELPDRFEAAAAGTNALAGLLGRDGPRRLMLVVQNNAELRGTGGLVSVFGQAVARDGRLEVQPFSEVDDVADPVAEVRRVPAPDDYRRLWGPYLADTTLWKSTNMTPDGPTAAAVLTEVAAVTLPERSDGAIWFDVRTLGALLGATSPARLPNGTLLDEDNAVDVLLSQVYREADGQEDGQDTRRAQLRSAADSLAKGLLEGSPSPTGVASALSRSAAGRHLFAWSARPQEQAGLVEAGLSGAVQARDGDLSSVVLNNLGGGDTAGNKIDYYGRRDVSVSAVVGEDTATVTQVLTLRNTAPASGLPPYVAGVTTPGVSNNLVTLALPADAELLELSRDGRRLRGVVRPEGDHSVVTDVASTGPGGSTVWRLRYRLPLSGGAYDLRLHPQPLAVDAELSVEVVPVEGVHLEPVPGRTLDGDGALRVTEPYDEGQEVSVTVTRDGLAGRVLDAVRRFWTSPVELP